MPVTILSHTSLSQQFFLKINIFFLTAYKFSFFERQLKNINLSDRQPNVQKPF